MSKKKIAIIVGAAIAAVGIAAGAFCVTSRLLSKEDVAEPPSFTQEEKVQVLENIAQKMEAITQVGSPNSNIVFKMYEDGSV